MSYNKLPKTPSPENKRCQTISIPSPSGSVISNI